MSLQTVCTLRRTIFNTLILLVLLVCSMTLVFFGRDSKTRILEAVGKNVLTNTSVSKIDLFYNLITEEERARFRTNLAAFLKVVPQNVTYFIEGGTLLGAYRHGGMIPWDDDLDLLVKDSDRTSLERSLTSLAPEYELNTRDKLSWKFSHSSSKANPEKFKWPFLDIFFYLENATHLWISQKAFKHTVYEKTLIFPRCNATFMNLQVPAPHNISAILDHLYDVDVCVTNMYSHRREKFRPKHLVVQVPCQSLYSNFAFSPSYLKRHNPV